ncbi:hypothetical protein SLI_4864 [Streptomyces lividans 1326]|uniref:Uncharacterized protein n=1 Tax=Streptomyces lividans 1326 TaxID=1200984 RepID=A0A7U9DSX7_STRLI|nr:hypothetical protein SLI_4864 [Streptomyces lividans 1326]
MLPRFRARHVRRARRVCRCVTAVVLSVSSVPGCGVCRCVT